jgi:hypothetical protein
MSISLGKLGIVKLCFNCFSLKVQVFLKVQLLLFRFDLIVICEFTDIFFVINLRISSKEV